DEPRCVLRVRDVGLDRAAADHFRELLRVLCAGAVPDNHFCAATRKLLGNRAADALRRAGDEGALAVERGEAHAWEESSSGSRSSESRLLIETVWTLRSIRFTRPERTLPGPTSTNVLTPARISSVADWVKRTGAVSWSTRSGPIRCADSTRA